MLADYLGKGKEVSEWTAKAMGGNVKFEDALGARLSILQPTRKSVEACMSERPFKLTPGIADLVSALHENNVAVWLVSGGFEIMIEPIAATLNIPRRNIIANRIIFKDDDVGSYDRWVMARYSSSKMYGFIFYFIFFHSFLFLFSQSEYAQLRQDGAHLCRHGKAKGVRQN